MPTPDKLDEIYAVIGKKAAMTTETKHTPTPWLIKRATKLSHIHSQSGNMIGSIDGDANAAFIVDACNNISREREINRELVKTVKRAEKVLREGQPTLETIECVTHLQAALTPHAKG